MDHFKERFIGTLKKTRKAVFNMLKKPLKRLLIVAIAIILIIISLVGSYDALVKQFSDKASDHMKNNPVKYDAKGESILIDEEQIAMLEGLLENMGTSKERLHLTTKDLEKLYAAEVVTQEINRGVPEQKDKYYGRVYIKKAGDSTELEDLKDLTYIDFEEFQTLDANEIRNYFSIDGDQLCVASIVETNSSNGDPTQSINIHKLNYKNQLTPYMMPLEFLLDLCIITENPEFVMELAEKVINETKIVLAVMEETETTITVTTKKYTEMTETWVKTDVWNKEGVKISHEEDGPDISEKERTETTRDKVFTVTPIVKVAYVDSWFIEQQYIYNKVKKETVTEIPEDDPSNKIEDEPRPEHKSYEGVSVDEAEDGTTTIVEKSEVSWKVNIRQSVKITNIKVMYEQGITKEPLDKAQEFLELLQKPFKKPDSFMKKAAIGDIVSGAGILLQMLEGNERTQAVEHIMRYILYVYTGDYYGVTELDLSLFEANGFSTISSSSLSAYLRQFSHSGEAAQSPDGKYYQMYGDGVGWPTIGNADLQWKSHHSKFAVPGNVRDNGEEKSVSNVEEFVNSKLPNGPDAKYSNTEINQMQIYVEKELVDSIGDTIQEKYYNSVVNSTQGLNLSRQQLYALTTISYNFGHLPEKNGYTFKEVYQAGAAKYQVNSPEHNKFIWDNWWCYLEGGAAGHIPARDAAFETYVKGIYDFSQSDAGTVFGRSKYIYYTQEQINRIKEKQSVPNKPITRTPSNEKEIFTYQENSVGTNGITSIDDVELKTYTNKAGRTFIEYKQNIGPWASKTYDNGTIEKIGCSITCLAIVSSGYGYDYKPDKWSGPIVNMLGQAQSVSSKNTTRISISPKTNVPRKNKKDIQEHLKAGNEVIIHVYGKGGKIKGSNPYTSNQHWMVLLDISEDGSQVYVSNPWNGHTTGWADIDTVLISLADYIKISN